mmetsp:Transcript_48179/g.111629  ORF Transcript_48179/g.111629 Transcript_48179/m.111629 type:complete len:603 (-) Transcript_48179:88-1896(-)|eukprot:CAMPEP_0171059430 /NCGR_PEP_ID=MMETSP0766_2-20121228/3171_1 /TAXON_ID=439317 /ORGANISM="Gambierdiscus australes, Strain CAWD 149" /LENGTH=602 /DNA_ID=CAMNT_0011514865 /DNA_START=37 /DNA_END=1845 /DNA_ORIENTATION=-
MTQPTQGVLHRGTVVVHIAKWLPAQHLPRLRRVNVAFHSSVEALLKEDPSLRDTLDRLLASLLAVDDKRVWVGVRLRPQQDRVSTLHAQRTRVALDVGKSGPEQLFFFDRVFDGRASQTEVWRSFEAPLMRCLLRHEHACLLAYGQTGSGKTHTMFGSSESEDSKGVAFRAVESLARLLSRAGVAEEEERAPPSIEFSFLEVYNEKVQDLLAHQRLCTLRGERDVLAPGNKFHAARRADDEHVVVKGLTRRTCSLDRLVEQVSSWLDEGAASRVVGRTVFNPRSSRSHAVATLHICWPDDRTKHGAEARLYLVDLAGSERAGKCALGVDQLKEGTHINQSLSTLGRVVGSLARGQGEHVCYRDSALTWLLKDAITGRSARAFMIAAVQPTHPAETLSTLRYAQAYSSLQSDLSTRIPRLRVRVRSLQFQMEAARLAFDTRCEEINANSRFAKVQRWSRDALSQHLVRAGRHSEDSFQQHPYLCWTDAHYTKAVLGMVGTLEEACDVPPPRSTNELPDGRRCSHRPVAEVQPSRSAQVRFEGKHGHPATVLWFPLEALEDVMPPQHLTELLTALERAETAFLHKKRQLEEAQRSFAEQQQRMM